MNRVKVLLIEPDDVDAVVTQENLAEAAPGLFVVRRRRFIDELINSVEAPSCDICIVDLDFTSTDELEHLSWLCNSYCADSAVVVYAGNVTEQEGLTATMLGAEDFWIKGDVELETFAGTLLRSIERKKRENVLRRQQMLIRHILDSIADGVASADHAGNLTYFNKAASHLAGMGRTDSLPNSWQETYGVFRPDRRTPYPADETPLFKAIQGHPVDDAHLFVRHSLLPEGRLLSLNGRPLVDEGGRKIGGVVSFREVFNDSEN